MFDLVWASIYCTFLECHVPIFIVCSNLWTCGVCVSNFYLEEWSCYIASSYTLSHKKIVNWVSRGDEAALVDRDGLLSCQSWHFLYLILLLEKQKLDTMIWFGFVLCCAVQMWSIQTGHQSLLIAKAARKMYYWGKITCNGTMETILMIVNPNMAQNYVIHALCIALDFFRPWQRTGIDLLSSYKCDN